MFPPKKGALTVQPLAVPPMRTSSSSEIANCPTIPRIAGSKLGAGIPRQAAEPPTWQGAAPRCIPQDFFGAECPPPCVGGIETPSTQRRARQANTLRRRRQCQPAWLPLPETSARTAAARLWRRAGKRAGWWRARPRARFGKKPQAQSPDREHSTAAFVILRALVAAPAGATVLTASELRYVGMAAFTLTRSNRPFPHRHCSPFRPTSASERKGLAWF
jgi:hypothetical protein